MRELGGIGRGSAQRFEAPEVRYLLESGEFPLIAQFLAGGARPRAPISRPGSPGCWTASPRS
jgi:hypothetical protein